MHVCRRGSGVWLGGCSEQNEMASAVAAAILFTVKFVLILASGAGDVKYVIQCVLLMLLADDKLPINAAGGSCELVTT
jgi:hypothetical protein